MACSAQIINNINNNFVGQLVGSMICRTELSYDNLFWFIWHISKLKSGFFWSDATQA